MTPNYVRLNTANWESRVGHHVGSAEYALQSFARDPKFQSGVVRFDLPRLGDIAGRDLVHLQCHIGTDTLSLARLGARATGLDFSPTALTAARQLAARCGQPVEFVEAEVCDAPLSDPQTLEFNHGLAEIFTALLLQAVKAH